MQSVVLKGTQNGYNLIFNQSKGVKEIFTDLTTLLDKLNKENKFNDYKVSFKIILGNRMLTKKEIDQLKNLFNNYPNFFISNIHSNVVTLNKARQLKEYNNVHTIHQTIRNGQECRMHGDVLFFGNIHAGGKLYTDGNIYLLGNVYGIVHAGVPNCENKLIIGNLHNAQQIRIGEQFDIVADKQIKSSDKTVAYVNDLHSLDYGKLDNLKHINPKFYNRIGGVM